MLRAATFLSAFLLFQVQPMLARYILPWFGGSPAVWTTCLLFFQAVLLAGYLYAHWLTKPRVHVALLLASLAFLPIAPAEHWKPAAGAEPVGRILLLLAATVIGPYFMLSSTAPLLQRWSVAKANGSERTAPWRLYALSNAGSFLGMLSYPFVVEPFLRLRTQIWTWSALYVVYAALCAYIAWTQRTESARTADAARPLGMGRWGLWIGLAAAGTTTLMAVTNQITQDIAVSPFLWVLPLAVYLLTFILAFGDERWYRRQGFAVLAGVLTAVACGVYVATVALGLWTQVVIDIAALFAVCMVCHGELYRSRPDEAHLTRFYIAVTAGGLVGGVFTALIAPRVFNEYFEWPLGLALACALGFVGWARSGAVAQWTRNLGVRFALMSLGLGAATGLVTVTLDRPPSLALVRDFYGILRVVERQHAEGPTRELTHGRVNHGIQFQAPERRAWPTTYFGPSSGAGTVLASLTQPNRHIGIIGMGTGTLAAWGRPGDAIRFYEIDPQVEDLARKWFTFLPDSKARVESVIGDARVQLENEAAQGRAADYDVFVVDAFSGDSIPIHLITSEAADIYRKRLKQDGVLLFHISNRTLDLRPVVLGLARHLGWEATLFSSMGNPSAGETAATWVALSERPLSIPVRPPRVEWPGNLQPIAWSDDFASLWHVMKFE